jgi:flagellar hook assembly protein FlgD
VYDVHGKTVATLFDGVSPGGEIELQWNGRDDAGLSVGSGVYFYRLQGGGRAITRKMLLIK